MWVASSANTGSGSSDALNVNAHNCKVSEGLATKADCRETAKTLSFPCSPSFIPPCFVLPLVASSLCWSLLPFTFRTFPFSPVAFVPRLLLRYAQIILPKAASDLSVYLCLLPGAVSVVKDSLTVPFAPPPLVLQKHNPLPRGQNSIELRAEKLGSGVPWRREEVERRAEEKAKEREGGGEGKEGAEAVAAAGANTTAAASARPTAGSTVALGGAAPQRLGSNNPRQWPIEWERFTVQIDDVTAFLAAPADSSSRLGTIDRGIHSLVPELSTTTAIDGAAAAVAAAAGASPPTALHKVFEAGALQVTQEQPSNLGHKWASFLHSKVSAVPAAWRLLLPSSPSLLLHFPFVPFAP